MRYFLLMLLLVAANAFAGDLVAKNKETGAELRLLDTVCSHGETLGVLREEWRPKFKNARILSATGVIKFYGCWVKEDDDRFVVILSDGSARVFTAKDFVDPAI